MYRIRVLHKCVERGALESTPHQIIIYHRGMPLESDQAVEEIYRSDWGRIVAALIRLVGDFELAEEAAQEAFAAAVDQWRTGGIPEFPRAWIIQTARHKAIDRIRRLTRHNENLETYAMAGWSRSVEVPDYD